jgi:cytochrome c oxidase cbb3-type subunit 3
MSSADIDSGKADHGTEVDAVTGTPTTGHEWDGIRELNTPLPRWWLWTLYLTIVWSIGYWVVYPAWPLVTGYTRGVFNYSSRASLAEDMQVLEAARTAQAAGLKAATLEQIKADPSLLRIALARGKAAFGDNCVGCHGQGGAGATSYPTLTDDDWIWGGKLSDIETTISHGVRWAQNDKTRIGEMPAFVRTGMLKKPEAELAVEYVRSLARLDVLPGTDLAKGKELYDTNCAACHGAEGKGNREVGSPDLTDAIWLYGSSRQAMNEGVANGRAGVMPAWSGRLDPVTIKALTVYVHSLGGGEQ